MEFNNAIGTVLYGRSVDGRFRIRWNVPNHDRFHDCKGLCNKGYGWNIDKIHFNKGRLRKIKLDIIIINNEEYI